MQLEFIGVSISKDGKAFVGRRVTNNNLIFICKAIEEFQMIQDGDRVLVCVSGGKDSLSMLHTLHQYQFYAKTKVMRWGIKYVNKTVI